jgi:hypothetical protein
MQVQDVGHAALSGWRKRLADAVAPRAPLRDDYVRAGLGLVFLALSIRHLAHTARELAARA